MNALAALGTQADLAGIFLGSPVLTSVPVAAEPFQISDLISELIQEPGQVSTSTELPEGSCPPPKAEAIACGPVANRDFVRSTMMDDALSAAQSESSLDSGPVLMTVPFVPVQVTNSVQVDVARPVQPAVVETAVREITPELRRAVVPLAFGLRVTSKDSVQPEQPLPGGRGSVASLATGQSRPHVFIAPDPSIAPTVRQDCDSLVATTFKPGQPPQDAQQSRDCQGEVVRVSDPLTTVQASDSTNLQPPQQEARERVQASEAFTREMPARQLDPRPAQSVIPAKKVEPIRNNARFILPPAFNFAYTDAPVHPKAAAPEAASAVSALRASAAVSIPDEKATPAAAAQELVVRIERPDAPNVDVHVVERRGQIQIAVRTADAELQTSLRGNLTNLVQSMGRAGYRAETYTPRIEAVRETSEAAFTGFIASERTQNQPLSQARFTESESNGSGHRHQQQEQQQQQQNPRRQAMAQWMQFLENAA